MYKIEYDVSFPGFRLTHNGNWCETYPLVGECLFLIARREGVFVPCNVQSESHLLAYLCHSGIDIDIDEDW